MQMRLFFVLIFGMVVGALGPAQAQVEPDDVLNARTSLAASEAHRVAETSRLGPNAASLSHDAITVRGGRVIDTVMSGPAAMVGIVEIPQALLGRRSTESETALALSTGQVGSDAPAPGSAFGARSADPDQVTLSITVQPDEHLWLMLIQWNLLTTEISEFSELGFNDVFSITVTDASGTRALLEMDTSDPDLRPVSNTRMEGSSYNLYSRQAALLPAEYGLGMPAAKLSGWRTTGFAIEPDAPVEIEITLRDGLDGLMDTQAIIREIGFTAFIPHDLKMVEPLRISSKPIERGLPGEESCLPDRYCNSLFPYRGQFAGLPQPPPPPRFCSFSENVAAETLDFNAH